MLGLMVKDLILIKKKLSLLYLLPLVIIAIATSQNLLVLTAVLPSSFILIAVLQPIQCMEYDEVSKWDETLKTLPCSSLDVIASRYFLAVAFMVAASVTMLTATAIIGVFAQIDIVNLITFCLMGLFSGSLYAATVIPSTYRFGFTKSRYVLFIVVALLTAVPFVLQFLGIDAMALLSNDNLMSTLGIALGLSSIVLLAVSFLITLKIDRPAHKA